MPKTYNRTKRAGVNGDVANLAEYLAEIIEQSEWTGRLVDYCKGIPRAVYGKNGSERVTVFMFERLVACVWKLSEMKIRTWIEFEDIATKDQVCGCLRALVDAIDRGPLNDWLAEFEIVVSQITMPNRKHSQKHVDWLGDGELEDRHRDAESQQVALNS